MAKIRYKKGEFWLVTTVILLISLVWGGFYVMMAGGLTALLRRARDSRQAALA